LNLALNEIHRPARAGTRFPARRGAAGAEGGPRPGAAGRCVERGGLELFFSAAPLHVRHRNVEDGILFGLYFVVAIVLGQLVARIRLQEEAERRREERATALYEMSRDLAEAASRDEVVWQLVSQINRVFHTPVAVALPENNKLFAHPDSSLALSEKELSVADWAFRQRKAAGRFTDNLPGAEAHCICRWPPSGRRSASWRWVFRTSA
jgi:K+-sensing histidine kinase KdpD